MADKSGIPQRADRDREKIDCGENNRSLRFPRAAAVVFQIIFLFMPLISCSKPQAADEKEQKLDIAQQARFQPPPAEASPDPPLHVGGDVTAPIKVTDPQPLYTEEARKARIQGTVILQAIIDKAGNVANVKVLEGLPMGLGLEEEALKAIKRWKFRPATLHDTPVSVYYNLTVNFRLR